MDFPFGGGGGDGGGPYDCMFTSIGDELDFAFAFACGVPHDSGIGLTLPAAGGEVIVVAFGGGGKGCNTAVGLGNP